MSRADDDAVGVPPTCGGRSDEEEHLLGGFGPAPEGMAMWIIGMVAAIGLALWIGARS